MVVMSDSGAEDAWFEALYRRNAPAVLAYARRRLTDPQDSEDVVVEVFGIAWRRRRDLPDDPLPWLYATAGNVIAHMTRAHTRRGRLGAKLASQPCEDVQPPVEVADTLLAALSQLPESDQEILRLWAWEDLDGAGLALALGCSPGTARTRLHRARTRLRTVWTRDMPEEGTA